MISSFFGKTKPINYIVLLGFLFLFYLGVQFLAQEQSYDLSGVILQILVLAILLFSFFVINFVVKRNKITGNNSFSLLFYVLLIVLFPETLLDNYAIGCSFFLLLALRRLISIRSMKNIKLKIFDATLWIAVASLCYNWAILYLLLVLAAIYIYEPKNIRNWLVPLAGLFVFFMILYSVTILAGNSNFLFEHYKFQLNLDSIRFVDLAKSGRRIVYVVLISITGLLSFLKLSKVGVGKIVTLRLIALSFIIGLVLEVLMSGPDHHPLMVTFFPAVIFLTNYIESVKKANIKELLLMVAVALPFLVLGVSLLIGK